jgi:hypothetical protein
MRATKENTMGNPVKKLEPREWTDAGPIGSAAEAKWQGEQLSFRVDAFPAFAWVDAHVVNARRVLAMAQDD